MEYPPAAHGDAPLRMSMAGPSALLGFMQRPMPSESWTILGGSTFHLQNPMSTYSGGSPLLSAYSWR